MYDYEEKRTGMFPFRGKIKVMLGQVSFMVVILIIMRG